MSTTETQREQEQVTGTLVGIVQKGPDKWQAVVLPDGKEGTDHTKSLWTKDENLIRTLATMINQRMAFLCNASHWKMNDGTPVRSLWIDQVGPSAAGSPALAGPPQNAWESAQQAQAVAQGGYQNVPPPQNAVVQPQPVQMQAPPPLPPLAQGDQREQKIHRQTASKVAAIMLTHVKPEERNMSTLLVLAERLVAYYDHGLPPQVPATLDDLLIQATPRTVDEGPPPLPADDDIPF